MTFLLYSLLIFIAFIFWFSARHFSYFFSSSWKSFISFPRISYFLCFVIIAISLYFVSVHDVSYIILLFILELFHLTSIHPMAFTLLS
jgi:hypothetical protein